MTSPEVTIDPASPPWPEDLVPVGRFASSAEGEDRGLVILAMGLPYWLLPFDDRFVLLIERGQEAAVGEQLARYERESVGWPPAPSIPTSRGARAPSFTPLLWAFCLVTAFWIQLSFPAWTSRGSLDAAALFDRGEWWRPATALFLHGDAGHLLSNLLAGVFVFTAVLSTFGRTFGWSLLVLAALGGNLTSAAIHHPASYHSLGASTAVFAGLGLLTGRALAAAFLSSSTRQWQSVFVPFGAGLILLALFGAGGPRVDLGAHVCGFAAGLLLGVVSSALSRND
jgi:rhomboid protease GluP